MHDEASVNIAAVKRMHEADDLPVAASLHCLSHALNNVGEHLTYPCVQDFKKDWHQLMAHSENAKRLYREMVGRSPPNITNFIRWYVSWEESRDLYRDWAYLRPFLEALTADSSSNAAASCLKHLKSDEVWTIYFGLLVITEHGRELCKTCYFFEGDGFLFPFAEKKLLDCLAALDPTHSFTTKEEECMKYYAQCNQCQISTIKPIWSGIRNIILSQAHEYLQQMMPENPPAPNDFKGKIRCCTMRYCLTLS
jgi:hypothetical protein